MSKRGTIVLTLVFLSALALGNAVAEDTETLKGSFLWNNEDQTGDLEAVFSKTGDNTWDVAFHFEWEGAPRTFSGTAEGSLSSGELKGEVMSDGERPSPFYFTGSFEDGVFKGTHGGMRNGEKREAGTLTLSH